jgi:hypothetical protein
MVKFILISMMDFGCQWTLYVTKLSLTNFGKINKRLGRFGMDNTKKKYCF